MAPNVQRQKRKGVVVLGVELARAGANEERREAEGPPGPSPLPDSSYNPWRGETSLIDPKEIGLDGDIREVVRRFAAEADSVRATLRASTSMDGFYTLLTFARRASVFAMRQRSVAWVTDGLAAVAMIEADRTDPRDILMALSVLYHAAGRVGADPNELFREAASISEPSVAELITQYASRPRDEKDLRSSWGLAEIETENGVGLIDWGFKEYHPTSDLGQVIMDIAELVAADKYQPESVSIAESLPAVWLTTKEDRSAEQLVERVRGGASLLANLRPEYNPDDEDQGLIIFLVEARDDRTAEALLGLSRKKALSDYVMLGLAEGRLFCLAIQRSFNDAKPYETSESLARFSAGIAKILGQH